MASNFWMISSLGRVAEMSAEVRMPGRGIAMVRSPVHAATIPSS
jgi:hypothetical protein